MHVSVLIPMYRGAHRLRRLFASFVANGVDGVVGEVCVWDDGSPQDDRERSAHEVDSFAKACVGTGFRPRASFSYSPVNQGWISSVRALVAESQGDVLLVLDDDVEVPTGLFDRLRTLCSEHPSFGVFSWKSYGVKPGQAIQPRPGFLEPATQLAGYCMAFQRAVWDELGGLDQRFKFYCSDSDFSLRAQLAGYPCYRVWDPLVIHEEHGAFRDAPELDSGSLAARDLTAFREKWEADGPEMERRALTTQIMK